MTEVYRNTSGSIGNSRSDSKCSEVVPLKAKVEITDNSGGACTNGYGEFIMLNYVFRETLSTINWRSQLNIHTSSSYISQSNTYPWSRWTTYRETYNQELNAMRFKLPELQNIFILKHILPFRLPDRNYNRKINCNKHIHLLCGAQMYRHFLQNLNR